MRHLPYEERLQRLGLHCLQRRRHRADLIIALKIFMGLLGIDPPARRGLRGHPFKVLQGASRRRRRGSAFSVKCWNKLPASTVTVPSANVFKKRLEKVWAKIFPHLTKTHNTPPQFHTAPPSPTCTPPTCSYIKSILYIYIYIYIVQYLV